jgi:hypothetical protein
MYFKQVEREKSPRQRNLADSNIYYGASIDPKQV